MRIEQFNAVTYGGAAIAARRLHHALLDDGVESRFWCAQLPASLHGDPSYRVLGAESRDAGSLARRFQQTLQQKMYRRRWKRALEGRPAGLEMFHPSLASGTTAAPPDTGQPRVLHLHWISGWLDYPSFFASVDDHQPIVWTLHDMHPITGGCHYAFGCERFLEGCGSCPQLGLGHSGPNDLSAQGAAIKQAALRGRNLHVVTPSQWLEREARRSPVFADARSFTTIRYGLDTDTFAPLVQEEARRQLNLPLAPFLVGFGAESLDNDRKGFRYLLESLNALQGKFDLMGLVFGSGELAGYEPLPPLRHMGFLDSAAMQRRVYAACDVFVMPSLEDNSPQTGLEALACGTPVIAFRTGGVPDFVRCGDTGLLADLGDAAHLARQIEWMAEHPQQRREMGLNGRALIVREFQRQPQAAAYVGLYESLLQQPAAIPQAA